MHPPSTAGTRMVNGDGDGDGDGDGERMCVVMVVMVNGDDHQS